MTDWDARLYRERTGFVSELGMPVLKLLDPRPGERILDVGCGDGMLSAKIAARGCEVVAIDASENMVKAARARGLDARLLDAARLADEAGFQESFDAVFSNAALHWMHPMPSVAEGIASVLKSGGRLVAEFGGRGNVHRIRTALHEALSRRGITAREVDPWHFPSAEEYAALLADVGLVVTTLELFDRPTALTTGVAGWIESVGRPFLNAVPPADRASLLAEVESALAPVLRDCDGGWRADYVRLRVAAIKGAA